MSPHLRGLIPSEYPPTTLSQCSPLYVGLHWLSLAVTPMYDGSLQAPTECARLVARRRCAAPCKRGSVSASMRNIASASMRFPHHALCARVPVAGPADRCLSWPDTGPGRRLPGKPWREAMAAGDAMARGHGMTMAGGHGRAKEKGKEREAKGKEPHSRLPPQKLA